MNRSHLPRLLAVAALALAAGAPAAQAAGQDGPYVPVCNEATPHSLGGSLVATDGDPAPPARFTEGLFRHPGAGDGLVTAAAHSPALSVCDENTGGGWGDAS